MEEKMYHTPRGTVHYWVEPCVANHSGTEETPWMVFLPGLTAEHHLFDEQILYFRKNYHCLTWDAPAHGASRPYEMSFTLDEVCRVLRAILEREGIDRPIMVGQSYGGYIAQNFLSLFPGSVRAFVSIDSCSLKRKYTADWVITWLKHTEWMYRCIPWKLLIAWSMSGLAESEAGRQNYRAAICAYQKKEFCRLCGRGFATVAEAIERNRPYEIDCPLLLLCGEKDAAGFTKEYNRHWSESEGCRLLWVPKAGHNSNADAPEFVNRAIGRFLEQTLGMAAVECGGETQRKETEE